MEVRMVNFRRTLTLTRFAGEGFRSIGRNGWVSAALLFLSIASAAIAFSAELRTITVLSYPDRPAKLPLWLAQDAGWFE